MRVAALLASLLAWNFIASAGSVPFEPGHIGHHFAPAAGFLPVTPTIDVYWPLLVLAVGCLLAGRRDHRD